MEKEYVYAEYTYDSKNPLARIAHRKRFSLALKLILTQKFDSLLDYGTGDGKLLIELKKEIPKSTYLSGYEPIMKDPKINGIKFYKEFSEIGERKFNVITCFEVLEHFNKRAEREMLLKISDLLKEDGILIISVPIEIGLPSLVKNVRRLFYGNMKWNFNRRFFRDSVKCLFALDIPEIRNSEGFINSHAGFNHKKLEKLFPEKFEIVSKIYSPFQKMPMTCNSQVFYKLKKKRGE